MLHTSKDDSLQALKTMNILLYLYLSLKIVDFHIYTDNLDEAVLTLETKRSNYI